jgi:hypothetical protein
MMGLSVALAHAQADRRPSYGPQVSGTGIVDHAGDSRGAEPCVIFPPFEERTLIAVWHGAKVKRFIGRPFQDFEFDDCGERFL